MTIEVLERMLGLPKDVSIGWVRWDLASGDLMVTLISERWKGGVVREICPIVSAVEGGVEWEFPDPE